jgi:hypothetical protein
MFAETSWTYQICSSKLIDLSDFLSFPFYQPWHISATDAQG